MHHLPSEINFLTALSATSSWSVYFWFITPPWSSHFTSVIITTFVIHHLILFFQFQNVSLFSNPTFNGHLAPFWTDFPDMWTSLLTVSFLISVFFSFSYRYFFSSYFFLSRVSSFSITFCFWLFVFCITVFLFCFFRILLSFKTFSVLSVVSVIFQVQILHRIRSYLFAVVPGVSGLQSEWSKTDIHQPHHHSSSQAKHHHHHYHSIMSTCPSICHLSALLSVHFPCVILRADGRTQRRAACVRQKLHCGKPIPLNGIFCADVPLRNYSLTHSLFCQKAPSLTTSAFSKSPRDQ